MININYQLYGSKGFNLRLRFYQGGETKYINVNKLLQGDIQRKHWNPRKQKLIPSCPFSEENNEILALFRHQYDVKALEWDGTVMGFLASFEADATPKQDKPTVDWLLNEIIAEQKTKVRPDGTVKGSYEGYEKLQKRLKEYCAFKKLDYDSLLIEEVGDSFITSVFDWVRKERENKGAVYISAMLHSTFNKAEEKGLFNMERLKAVKWVPKKSTSVQKYRTLTTAQCKQFVALKPSEMPKNPKSEFYRDFCTFIMYTGQSVCDAVALQYSSIKVIDGISHLVFNRRKIDEKQDVPCAVPINADMQRIMERWRPYSKDGYVFPVRNKKKLRTQGTNNGDIKHLISRLNTWLKKIGKILKCDFPLRTYTFRHTAITNYVSKGVPVVYVANMVGTSVENIEKIYYNNQGDAQSRNKVLGFVL